MTWTERGVERSANGAAIARLLYEASFEGRLQSFHGEAAGTAAQMLRGLAAIMYPDAGDPITDIDADRRYYLSESLERLGARIYSEQMTDAKTPADFAVRVHRTHNGSIPRTTITLPPRLGDES